MSLTTVQKPLWDEREDALYDAELSALYHQKRERFFELLDKLSKAASLIGGSAALWKIADPEVVQGIAMFIAVTSALSLVFSFSDRSRRHAELVSAFRLIIAEIAAKGKRHATEEDINSWHGKIRTLEAKEPPALAALVTLCQNELALAAEQPHNVHPQPVWVRALVHFFDMPRKN